MKIYITDCDHDSIEIEKNVFAKAGMDVTLTNAKTEDEVIAQCGDGDVFIVQYAQITRKVMDAIPTLKFIVRYGVGVDSIDLKAATEKNIQVGNVPDYGMNEVADHALALLLDLKRKISSMSIYTKNTKWDYVKAIPIHRFASETIGVIGLGRIGRNFAAKANALGFNVIGYDPYFKATDETSFIKSVSLEELVKQSDGISIHIPAEGNKDLFNRETFKSMKKTAVIINVARGGIINEADLGQALTDGEIAGAGIDCMATEPMQPNASLFKHENLIVTPHMAWYSEEAAAELKRKVAEESVRFAKGEPVHYPVNHLK
ncbi:C-terminal binding protein [Latilactobacillus fuchuensis]|uniref:C-terminal binding protein n=1 Tax=Latilactobacillus fuchuensis TaxID=164393 RepID=UPI0039AF999E